ncbi:glycoside hydrolase family 26 protein, partial [Xanthovirga aplysinae]|uniref:glycoside hydrolase family 26 protein n=1 Tax=Xanthovirga aplysinae TaxID=2529853 RepID=UPI001656DD6E
MKKLIVIFFAFFPLLLIGQKSSHSGAPKYAPEDGKKLLIMGQDLGAVGGLTDYDDGYVDHFGHFPAGVTTYAGFPGLSGLKFKANWGAGDVNAQAYVEATDFQNTTIVIGLHLVGKLKSIIAGSSDYDINILGEWIKEQDRPVFLRIGYEFDGSWNGYNPDDFKAAWIYIVKYFDDMDIRNVAYVWQSAGINTPSIERWYPGDEYVNWVGYSHFDGPNPGQSIRDFADAHDKPIMIAEATPRRDLKNGSGEGHWQAWFTPLFEKIYGNNRIKAFAYINADWESQAMWKGQGWGDSRLNVNDVIKASWEKEIDKEAWILASPNLFGDLKYPMWMDSLIITSVNEIGEKSKLQIERKLNFISISLTSFERLDGVSIIDFMGRTVFQDLNSRSEYMVPIKGLLFGEKWIIRIIKNNEVIVKK